MHDTTDTKTCATCGEVKLRSMFNRSKASRDGLQGKCRCCEREYKRGRTEREKLRAREWYARNRAVKDAKNYAWLASRRVECMFPSCLVQVGYYSATGMCRRHVQYRSDSGYQAAHLRVRTILGSASGYSCVCGCGEQATDWAYQYNAEGSEMICSQTGLRYSLNSDHYLPMSRSCHRKFDRKAKAVR